MNVHAVDTAKTRHISVQGNLQFQSDRDELYTGLKPGTYTELEVTFFDARILPAEVITRLMAFIAASHKTRIKINVFHRYLGSYLFRLGIRCHTLNQHASELRDLKRPGPLSWVVLPVAWTRSCRSWRHCPNLI